MIPRGFKNIVQEVIGNYNHRLGIETVKTESRDHSWKISCVNLISYTLYCSDVRALDRFLEKRPYTLAIADIPYGFNAMGLENDEEAFCEKDIIDMVNCFAKVTTSKLGDL